MKLCLIAAALLFCPSMAALAQSAAADADWDTIVALEAGPQDAQIRSRREAREVSLAHLAKQEAGLRDFLKKYPGTPHAVDAQLRLAHLLATRSDLTGKPAFFDAGLKILDAALQTAPEARHADLDFARIALSMRHIAVPSDRDRDLLSAQMAEFQTHHPNDRRVAALMAEVATLFDNQPRHKARMLRQALAAARTPELRARIQDDLKRLSFLGQPIELRGETATGQEVQLGRGKVALVYFFASWSPPSVAGLEEVEYLRKTFAGEPLEIIGVSLDSSPQALEAAIAPRGIPWPVIFDGKGWKSPLVRHFAINALPTLWILDRQGRLRTLNARTESETLVRELLKSNTRSPDSAGEAPGV